MSDQYDGTELVRQIYRRDREIERLRGLLADTSEKLMVAGTDNAGLRGLLREAREEICDCLVHEQEAHDDLRRRIDAALAGATHQPGVILRNGDTLEFTSTCDENGGTIKDMKITRATDPTPAASG